MRSRTGRFLATQVPELRGLTGVGVRMVLDGELVAALRGLFLATNEDSDMGTNTWRLTQVWLGSTDGTVVASSVRNGTNQGLRLSLPRFERRIGTRYPSSLPYPYLTWQPEVPKPWFRPSSKRQQATMVDVSVTGARIKAPANRHIQRGTMVVIALAGAHSGLVRVQRVDPAPDPTQAYYGVQFVSLDDALQMLIDDIVGAHRPNERDWR